MADDHPISGIPRYEYFVWAQMVMSAPGGPDREQLVLILREARENLGDADYVALQRDIRFIVMGERL